MAPPASEAGADSAADSAAEAGEPGAEEVTATEPGVPVFGALPDEPTTLG